MAVGYALPPLIDAQTPTAAISEAELWRAHTPSILTAPCLCGGQIRASNMARAIAEAVRVHNASTGHEEWAIAAGWR